MGASRNVTKVDSDKLKEYLTKKGINANRLSEEMGCSRNFISQVIRAKSVTTAYYKLLCLNLDVDEGYFLLKEEPKVEPAQTVQTEQTEQTEQEAYEATNDSTELLKNILNELVILNNNFSKLL